MTIESFIKSLIEEVLSAKKGNLNHKTINLVGGVFTTFLMIFVLLMSKMESLVSIIGNDEGHKIKELSDHVSPTFIVFLLIGYFLLCSVIVGIVDNKNKKQR
jgi:ABC-type Na+ efflux pump permease subunit